ncbi:DNA polymerase subunit gamma-2, mitochondrial isoform X2 [Euwallacea similis]|uniref:DNA polymerase subunit gamma-2, mitochondrial isoform X2 n=1 Tax=Euwallacea similis TaxID=1736056 RepID=UPI00344EE222
MFNLIINLCEKHGFLRKIASSKLNSDQLKVGPIGTLLLHNLKKEWHYNFVTNKENTVFLADNGSFIEAFQFARNICMERLPFGIAEIQENKSELSKENIMCKEVDFNNYFSDEDKVNLKCSIFVSSVHSTQFFHQWQRQRRIWWRKFSPNPGRYSITDIKTDENNIQTVQIMATYPWNSQLVETILLYPKPKEAILEASKFKDGKKIVQSHCVVSNISLNAMFMNTICDAYDESTYKGKVRTLLRFHRKIAPYSITFAIFAEVASNRSELKDLALYLTKQLRSNHLSTLLLPSSSKLPLQVQWRQYDELGVPYSVLLNERTLKDGLVLLRSRDTTLEEQVHVSELVAYMEQLFKNY